MQDAIETLKQTLGENQVATGEEAKSLARGAWGEIEHPIALVRPRRTEEVAAVMKVASRLRVPVVPWGGKTGLVDGAAAQGAIALSLERMNEIESIDADAGMMRAQAGVIVQTACEAAEEKGLFWPIDLGARGSATIGGVISTNAGGNHVVRYGMTRENIVGVEAVLANGEIVGALRPLIKNNTGYDLKQLFVGSEGTLGVVTRAVLRLRPAPRSQDVAFVGIASFADVVSLLRALQAELGGALSAFEVMWPDFYELVTTPPAKGAAPLASKHAFFVLIEALGYDDRRDADTFVAALERTVMSGLVEDAVIAKSKAEKDALWALRDDVMQVGRLGPIVTFDVSLNIADMESYVAQTRETLRACWPEAQLVVFGHLGDGNLHLIAGVGDRAAERRIEEIVYAPLAALNGSISAEHGIGLRKRDFLHLCRSPVEIELMRSIKRALDPNGILNPGKILA